MKVDGVNIT